MNVIKVNEVPEESVMSPLFTGGSVTRQVLLSPEMANLFELGMVNFAVGARNKFHIHTSDQVLFAITGNGIVATESHEHYVAPGDIIHIPAGEKHWHGATVDSSFSHITLLAAGNSTEQVEF